MGPTGKSRGTHQFLSTLTRQRIKGHQFTPIPMPDDIIKRVNDMVPTRSVDKDQVRLSHRFDDIARPFQHLDDSDSDDNDISYDMAHEFEDASHGDDLRYDDYIDTDELSDLGQIQMEPTNTPQVSFQFEPEEDQDLLQLTDDPNRNNDPPMRTSRTSDSASEANRNDEDSNHDIDNHPQVPTNSEIDTPSAKDVENRDKFQDIYEDALQQAT